MPLTPGNQLTVVSANLFEMWNNNDLGETRDMAHFAWRVRNVLSNPNIAVAAPDVVLLQEVTSESASTVATLLTSYTGRSYAVGVTAASGPGAVESNPSTGPIVRRETAIVYNTESVILSSPAASLLSYPESQVENTWLSLRQATALVTKRGTGKKYAVYATHFATHNAVLDHDAYGGTWAKFLKRRVTEIAAYAGATPVIAGDFNRTPCINYTNAALASRGYMTRCTGAAGEQTSGLWSAMTTSSTDAPGTYAAALPATEDSVDNLFTTGTILTARDDSDYREPYPAGPTRFPDPALFPNAFLDCHRLYDGDSQTGQPGGQGGSQAADNISGCAERYYSDHEFIWAVVQ
ncbi:MAG TPA: endonuclease/exonuclease/phosphatase family protein [Nocardioides sp.]|nr:endonuclease/exonuclease/phosphatase family protein [Nocardioides sp.]